MAQYIKHGTNFISNIESFGKNVFNIDMKRRLKAIDSIR
jgi:hypothetical protein